MYRLSPRDKAVISGLYLSKFDRKGLSYLNANSFGSIFNALGLRLKFQPASIKNYRDEFDSLFPNKRNGRKREIRPYVKKIYDKFNNLDEISFTNILRNILYKNSKLPQCDIFDKNKIYTFDELSYIAEKNRMAVINCIDDELMVSLEGYNGKYLSGENVFEFNMVSEDGFKLRWFDVNWRETITDISFKNISFQRKGGDGNIKTYPKTDLRHPSNNIQMKLKINKVGDFLKDIELAKYNIQ